ncbi:MAG: hypothetical protein M0P39_09380 [Rhodocyclaceae bacterium]|nr:hypothetical protein [Rhodocyclaceae bacterium]
MAATAATALVATGFGSGLAAIFGLAFEGALVVALAATGALGAGLLATFVAGLAATLALVCFEVSLGMSILFSGGAGGNLPLADKGKAQEKHTIIH